MKRRHENVDITKTESNCQKQKSSVILGWRLHFLQETHLHENNALEITENNEGGCEDQGKDEGLCRVTPTF
jgi:hypothetical protein